MLQETYLTPELAISTLVACDGNRLLAAERLSKQLQFHISPTQLTSLITGDPLGADSLTAQLKLSTLLQTYELLSKMLFILSNSLEDLTANELAKSTSQILTVFQSLTTSSNPLTANINVTEVVLKMLPPEAREAVLALTATTLPANGSSHAQ
jgi:hypothetical protein